MCLVFVTICFSKNLILKSIYSSTTYNMTFPPMIDFLLFVIYSLKVGNSR